MSSSSTHEPFLLSFWEENLPPLLAYSPHPSCPPWFFVSLGFCLLFGALKVTVGKVAKVESYSLLHCVIVAPLSLLCLHYDNSALAMTGVSEPLRTLQCSGPLTPLHTFLPLITLGYALLDLFEGLYDAKPDFILHGSALTLLFSMSAYTGTTHRVATTLVMEVSTVPLQFIHANLPPVPMLLVNLTFLLTFVACRLFLVPKIWYGWLATYYSEPSAQTCMPEWYITVVWVGGLVFHGLNFYWAFYIFKRVIRKAKGVEAMGENADEKEKGE